MALVINSLTCPQNHHCPIIDICPEKAISQSGFALPVIDQSRCTECGKCARYCPMKAVIKLG
jgi:ferredoxin